MKTGSSLGDPFVDCGAICMGPRQILAYQRLIDDAVSKGRVILSHISEYLHDIHYMYTDTFLSSF
jgi:hypothetical protein